MSSIELRTHNEKDEEHYKGKLYMPERRICNDNEWKLVHILNKSRIHFRKVVTCSVGICIFSFIALCVIAVTGINTESAPGSYVVLFYVCASALMVILILAIFLAISSWTRAKNIFQSTIGVDKEYALGFGGMITPKPIIEGSAEITQLLQGVF